MINFRLIAAVLFVLLVVVVAATVWSQEGGEDHCDRPEMRQFDFWVGQWDCHGEFTDSTGNVQTYAVTNTITLEYDSCVVVEHFEGAEAVGLRGTSVSTFNRWDEKWHQTWVDNNGSYLDFVGGFQDGVMELRRTANRHDTTFLQRMRWTDITDSSLTWQWERSDDDGATWQTLWTLYYEKKK